MKKTLIALAAVALSSAAFAQSTVTLSGKFGYAYQSTKSAAGVKANGFGVTDGNVTFGAVEDLGGGMKAAVSMDVRVRGRGAADEGVKVGGRDASVSLMGGFGAVQLGAVESPNGIIGLASAGAPVIGQDNGKTLDAAVNVDLARYVTPNMGGLQAYVSIADSIGGPGAGGLESTNALHDATQIGLTFAAGPIAAAADYSKFGTNGSGAANKSFGRTRISGSYNLGVVKLGAGYQNKGATTTTGAKNNQYMLGVSMPVGSMLLGATYANSKTSGAKASTGYELGAQYNFSKRTALQTAYLSQKVSGATKSDTALRIRLMHSF